MNNNYNITEYLVEPDFAKWLKEQGFDGECDYCIRANNEPNRMHVNAKNSDHPFYNTKAPTNWHTIPTFQQAFDFMEDRFSITVKIWFNGTIYNVDVKSFKPNELPSKFDWSYIMERGFKTKREANIAACKAIMQHTNDLQKDRV